MMANRSDTGGLQGRVAVVTGAARGIGRAVAGRLAEEGASVAVLDLDGGRASQAAGQLRAASAWACDVRSFRIVKRTMEEVESTLGPVDVLINNAGIWRHTPLLEAGEGLWDEVYAVNVKGVLFCCQAIAPSMVERKLGKIVNIASVAGFGGTVYWGAYSASKSAVISLTQSFAEEPRPHNVQVNAVCPGATQTPMLEYIAETEAGSGFGLVHSPEEVAEEVYKLVWPFGQITTGSVVPMKPVESVFGIPVQSE